MKDTICWECANACGGCSWSRDKASPIPGWNAIRRDLEGGIESYIVVSCPEFVPDGRKHTQYKKQGGRKKWDSAEILQLYRLRREGKTIGQCAIIMQRTRESIKKRLMKDRRCGFDG